MRMLTDPTFAAVCILILALLLLASPRKVAALILMIPFYPFLLLRKTATAVVTFCDWATDGPFFRRMLRAVIWLGFAP